MTPRELDTPKSTRRPLPAMLLAAALGLVFGYVVLELVNAGIALMWETLPATWEQTPAWYVLGVLLTAAVLVYVVRRFIGDTGHSPIGGIKVSALTPRDYLPAILAILASLWGGIVLGPEVALVATGSVMGGLVATWMRANDAASQKKIVGFGALGALLALFVGPLLSGTLKLDGPPKSVEVDDLAWAIAVAIIVALLVTLARVIAAFLSRVAGSAPHLPVLLVSAFVIGLAALWMHYLTGEPVIYVATSGEELISELPTLTSISTVVAIVLFKTLAYSVSLGSGFRGGPFFPAMFIGASVGLLASLAIPNGPSIAAAMVVGVVASVIATAPLKWPIVILLGIVIGFAMGSWTLIPAALTGAVVARLIPRWGDRYTAKAGAHAS